MVVRLRIVARWATALPCERGLSYARECPSIAGSFEWEGRDALLEVPS
jgi:hypothetical protein